MAKIGPCLPLWMAECYIEIIIIIIIIINLADNDTLGALKIRPRMASGDKNKTINHPQASRFKDTSCQKLTNVKVKKIFTIFLFLDPPNGT